MIGPNLVELARNAERSWGGYLTKPSVATGTDYYRIAFRAINAIQGELSSMNVIDQTRWGVEFSTISRRLDKVRRDGNLSESAVEAGFGTFKKSVTEGLTFGGKFMETLLIGIAAALVISIVTRR